MRYAANMRSNVTSVSSVMLAPTARSTGDRPACNAAFEQFGKLVRMINERNDGIGKGRRGFEAIADRGCREVRDRLDFGGS